MYLTQLNQSSQVTHVDAPQGESEARTEPYSAYGEGALEVSTQRSATSIRRVTGFASEQANALRDLGLLLGLTGLCFSKVEAAD